MAEDRLVRVMAYQYKAACGADHPNLIPLMNEADAKDWHFLVCNLPGAYAGGEYLFRLRAPEDFPTKPPEFSFLTPNGVFGPGGKICISIGEFHADNQAGKTGSYGWRPALGMIGFAREVANGMINPAFLGGGIRVLNDPFARKAQLAATSVAFNQNCHSGLLAEVAAFEAAHPDYKAVRHRKMWRAAAAIANADFTTTPLESLPANLADAFGDLWAPLESGVVYLASIPDLPFAQLEPMGFPASGRAVLEKAEELIREAALERDESVRKVLVFALRARLLWESRSPEGPEAFAAFLELLPGVCGGASAASVPDAFARVAAAPAAFPRVHGDLSRFLRTEDIDEKARRGKVLAARALAEAAVAAAPEGGKNAPPLEGDLDELIDDLLAED